MSTIDFKLIREAKRAAGYAASRLVQDGMLIGLGTGSTTTYLIEALGRRCREEGLHISAIASSQHSLHLAQQAGIPMKESQEVSWLDLTIDGADEIDPHKNMIKGGGGALLREKILAYSSQELVIIVDETKLVHQLGVFPVAVEIAPFAYQTTLKRIEELHYKGKLRFTRDGSLYTTDNGNYIIDIQFVAPILDPQNQHLKLKQITGVLETGLFFNIADRIVVGYLDGFTKIQA